MAAGPYYVAVIRSGSPSAQRDRQWYFKLRRFWILVQIYCGAVALMCGCSGGSGLGSRGIASRDETDHDVANIRKAFGVQVHLTYDPDRFFPASWKRARSVAQGLQIEPYSRKRMMRLIPGVLAMYPPELVSKNLRGIYLLKYLSCYGCEFAGTYSRDSIYITNRGKDRRRSRAGFVRINAR